MSGVEGVDEDEEIDGLSRKEESAWLGWIGCRIDENDDDESVT